MAKGVKKIEWTGKGEIIGNFSVKNPRAKIKADQFVYFKIAEWHEGTTEQEKKGTVLWHFQTHDPRESVLKFTKKGDEIYVTDSPDGMRMTAHNPAFESQMRAARDIMKNRRAVLRELAK